MPAAGEAGDVGNVAERPGGAAGSYAVELLQGAAGGRDQFGQLPVRVLGLLVDDGEFGDQLGGQLPAGAADDVRGRTVFNRARACWAERYIFAPPGTSSSSKGV